MASEFMVWFDSDEYGRRTGEATAVYRVDGDAVTITATGDEFRFGGYVENGKDWLKRRKLDRPLQDMFGRNAYIAADFYEYNGDTKATYDDAVAALTKRGATSKTFKPKG